MKFNRSIILSVVIHLVIIGLLVFNFSFSKIEHKQSNNPQPKINARAINSQNVDKLVKKLQQKKQDDKRKEQKRLNDLKKAEQDAKRKRKQEEQKTANTLEQRKKAEQQRIAEEKKALALKKKRLKKEKEEKEQKKKAEAEKQRKVESERKRKLAEEKRKAKEEVERKEKERKRKEAEEKKRQDELQREMDLQMDAEAAALAEAHRQQVMTEVDKYAALIQGKIERSGYNPEKEGYCIFKIQISSNGLVLGVEALEGDKQYCESGERAIMNAEPLPVSRDPDVFEELKSINLTLGKKPEN